MACVGLTGQGESMPCPHHFAVPDDAPIPEDPEDSLHEPARAPDLRTLDPGQNTGSTVDEISHPPLIRTSKSATPSDFCLWNVITQITNGIIPF